MIDPTRIDEERLAEFVVRQRWFGAKTREVVAAHVLEAPLLRTTPPLLAEAFVEIRFQPGTHDIYQLPLGLRPASERWDVAVVGEVDGWTAYDALADPTLAREFVSLTRSQAVIPAPDASLSFHQMRRLPERGAELWDVRRIGAEQSNSSVVYDEELILKVYRRLEAGINPELELLRFLTEHEFPNIAALAGWFEYAGRLIDATLGVLQEFVPGEDDGWSIALASLEREPERFIGQARRLGEVTGAMHAALASDASDPTFAPEEPSTEALALLMATIDEEIDAVFTTLPGDDSGLEPIVGRGEDVRERLRLLSHLGPVGRAIRTHGDYHLGQVLWTGADWIVLDFEGEPARSLPERRRKRSALRDVAGMLRSFAYAASAASLARGAEPPPDWEERAREEFLAGYLPQAEPAGILPSSADAIERLLVIFELEKAVYELRYELDHRPDWVAIPVAGIVRLLDATPAGLP